MRGEAVGLARSCLWDDRARDPGARATDRYDVLVVGAGPAGAAAAYWLAERGHRVLVVDKKRFPREKTCGDGLTPRAVRQLEDMGLDEPLGDYLRYDGLRSIAHGVTLELAWPEHPEFPVLWIRRSSPRPRRDGGGTGGEGRRNPVARQPRRWSRWSRAAWSPGRRSAAARPGPPRRSEPAISWWPTAPTPASGGRSAAARDRTYPLGMAVRGYFTSPYHDEPWIESHLDLRDRDGNHLPGYGWIFPVGDGTVNVGVGLLSTFHGWKSVNTSKLMDAFVATAPPRWGIAPETVVRRRRPAASSPPGGSVTPKTGPTWLVIGDAGRRRQPVQRGGHRATPTRRAASPPTSSTGRWRRGDGLALRGYQDELDGALRPLLQGRAAVRAAPSVTPRSCASSRGSGMQSKTLMEWVLRIMANLLRPDELGPAEAAYKAVAALVKVAPEP